MFGAEDVGFPPDVGGREPARFGLEEAALGTAEPPDVDAEAPAAGLLAAGGISLLGAGDCCPAASGVGLAVVATLFGVVFFEEQPDCAINRKALKPVSKKAFRLVGRNRNFIKPSRFGKLTSACGLVVELGVIAL